MDPRPPEKKRQARRRRVRLPAVARVPKLAPAERLRNDTSATAGKPMQGKTSSPTLSRMILGVVGVIAGVVGGFMVAFLSGLIFLPETGLRGGIIFVAFLGLIGGVVGGAVARPGWQYGLALGLLGGLLALLMMRGAVTGQYNPPLSGGIPLWAQMLKVAVFLGAAGVGGALRRHRHPETTTPEDYVHRRDDRPQGLRGDRRLHCGDDGFQVGQSFLDRKRVHLAAQAFASL